MNKVQTGHNRALPPFIWGITVFFSSACLMILELAAGRMLAQEAGSSLYTWTAVIGVVLTGLAVGNYIGGRAADRIINTSNPPRMAGLTNHRKFIAALFTLTSINCAAVIVLSHHIRNWSFLWNVSWPVYVLIHVSVLFFTPSILLGAISPLSAKAALEGRTDTGCVIGMINACCAAGSIAGTFAAGFWLVSAIGVAGVIWAVAGGLLAAALLFYPRYRPVQVWAVLLIALIALATVKGRYVEQTGAILTLRTIPDPNVIYEDQTQYCRIRVRRVADYPERRSFAQDQLIHSEIVLDDPDTLQYQYEQIYAAVTQLSDSNVENPTFLAIGGGGFVFPRYLKHRWPDSTVDVVEIDPGVIKAARQAFGLPADHGLNIFTMDGRNFVQGLIDKLKEGKNITRYDFIYGDTFDNFSVPYQLVTEEFNEKIAQILKDDGIYMLNLVDSYQSGLAVGSALNTLERTFKNVHVLAADYDYYNRSTFVFIASQQPVDIDGICNQLGKNTGSFWRLNQRQISELKAKAGRTILTDDYAPIDNFTGPVARLSGANLAAQAYIDKAHYFVANKQLNKALKAYMKAVEISPTMPAKNFVTIGEGLLLQRSFQHAVWVCQKALYYYDRPQIPDCPQLPLINLNMGVAQKCLGRNSEAKKYISRAIDGFKKQLENTPNDIEILSNLGLALVENRRFSEATEYLKRAIELAPANSRCRLILAEALISQKDYAGARTFINESITAMRQAGNEGAVAQFQQILGRLAYQSR